MQVTDVAKELGISRRAIYRLLKDGLLPSKTVIASKVIKKSVLDVDDGLIERLKNVAPYGDAWSVRRILQSKKEGGI